MVIAGMRHRRTSRRKLRDSLRGLPSPARSAAHSVLVSFVPCGMPTCRKNSCIARENFSASQLCSMSRQYFSVSEARANKYEIMREMYRQLSLHEPCTVQAAVEELCCRPTPRASIKASAQLQLRLPRRHPILLTLHACKCIHISAFAQAQTCQSNTHMPERCKLVKYSNYCDCFLKIVNCLQDSFACSSSLSDGICLQHSSSSLYWEGY